MTGARGGLSCSWSFRSDDNRSPDVTQLSEGAAGLTRERNGLWPGGDASLMEEICLRLLRGVASSKRETLRLKGDKSLVLGELQPGVGETSPSAAEDTG